MMHEPEFDKDGYPTERTLDRIQTWRHEEGYSALMKFVVAAWKYPDYIRECEPGHWELSTGGWSGNEDIIAALRRNTLFWMICWESSRRGGHYKFDLGRVNLVAADGRTLEKKIVKTVAKAHRLGDIDFTEQLVKREEK